MIEFGLRTSREGDGLEARNGGPSRVTKGRGWAQKGGRGRWMSAMVRALQVDRLRKQLAESELRGKNVARLMGLLEAKENEVCPIRTRIVMYCSGDQTNLVCRGGGGQLLGAADAQTAHHATFSTAPTHHLLGSANAETTPTRAPAAAADRTQRPDATCEGKNG